MRSAVSLGIVSRGIVSRGIVSRDTLVIGTSIIGLLCWVTLSCPASRLHAGEPSDQSKSALDVIESDRGGRHWVDEATAPPKSPTESLAAIQIEPGYRIDLFASEPLVRDPVAICFDQQGNLFAAEYGDYPIGPEAGGEPLSNIVMLEDVDRDGIADRRHVFADKLDFAHSMMAFKGGLLVGAKTKILFLRDTDGDHIADIRHTLFDGFTPAHPQMQIGNPRWGIDNWVYLNYGPGEVVSAAEPDKKVTSPRKDFRFHPLSMQFEADSGTGQFGNTVDRFGNRFYCTNRNPIITTFLNPEQVSRNPFHIVRRPFYDVAPAGGDALVYPLVAMKSNYLSHAGTHTAACGTTAYLGDLGDDSFQHSLFVCEPIGHLVTRSIVNTDALLLSARRAREQSDFIASTDTWFRPSSLATGPDGALYLADMYRLWVEHPKFLPPEIADKLDWRAGDDLGRIYRIVPSDSNPRPFQAPRDETEIVNLLDDPNGWRQFLAQRLLVENQSRDPIDAVRTRLSAALPTTRLHALWTLDGLDAITHQDLVQLSRDASAPCRIAALRLAATRLDDRHVLDAVTICGADANQSVRFQVALTLAGNDSELANSTLLQLARRDGHVAAFADGLLTSLRDRAGQILCGLIDDTTYRSAADSGRIDLIKRLAVIVGARGDLQELGRVFSAFERDAAGQHENEHGWRAAAIAGIGEGLPRYRGELGRLTLATLIANPPAGLKETIASVQLELDQCAQRAIQSDQPIASRVAAVELLAFLPAEQSATSFHSLLASDQPAEIQLASIDALQQSNSPTAAEIILDRWPQLGPSVRGTAVELLLRRTESTRLALDAMAAGKMNAAALSIDQRVQLLKHSDPVLREQATGLFGGVVSPNRQQVAKDYEPSLAMQSDPVHGKQVFTRICAACHRIRGEGHQAGPDLSDVRNRSKPALLYDILDPNSKVEPQFTAYSVLTVDGSVYTGLIESDSGESVVLKLAEGKTKTIGRAEIEQMKASDVSLMPEGIEKDVTLQQMADLLAFLKGD